MNNSEKQQEEMEIKITDETCCAGNDEVPEKDLSEKDLDEELHSEEDVNLLKEQLAEQTKLAEDYFNRLARVQADYDNFKRRTKQEKEDLYKYASEKLIVALLPVLDNFNRAVTAECGDIEDFKSGVDMIHRQLWNVLLAEGVAEVPAVGEPFDPTWHEAVIQVESDDYPENTVVEELQRGYLLKEKLIRVSMVKISKPSN